jgi:hypothetical protein
MRENGLTREREALKDEWDFGSLPAKAIDDVLRFSTKNSREKLVG